MWRAGANLLAVICHQPYLNRRAHLWWMKPICCPDLFGNLCFYGAAQALSTQNMVNWIPPQSQLEGRVIKTDVCVCVCACVAGTTFILKVKAKNTSKYISVEDRDDPNFPISYSILYIFDMCFFYLTHMHCTVHTQVPMDSRCACYSQVGLGPLILWPPDPYMSQSH